MTGAKKKTKPKKARLSVEQRKFNARQRAFYRQVRSIFQKTGFTRIPDATDKEFTFAGRTGDFDDIFVKENVIVCTEYTLSEGSNLGDHVKGKAHLFNLIHSENQSFIKLLFEKFPAVRTALSEDYHDKQIRLRILYCSPTEVKSEHVDLTSQTLFMWRGTIQYFKSLAETVRLSARHELFKFLRLPFDEIGENGKLPDDQGEGKFEGSLLPETHSNFPSGYKVVSFYVTPATLLDRAYVLRKDGWNDGDGLYQRMIDKKKIESIRAHLKKKERVFVNNVIVTLPDGTRLDNAEGKEVDPSQIDKTTPVTVKIPHGANTVGIIDGQHRIFSYYEDIKDDQKIRAYRGRQNLLATGIVYPNGLPQADRSRFEASLFLEINSTQNSAKSDLKQAIAVITDPYSADSIGKRVVTRLGQKGPLEALVERHFFDKGVLKTSSMVSYALARLVRIDGDESLIKHWPSPDKESVLSQSNDEALIEYVDYCASQLSMFLSAIKANLNAEQWAIATKDGKGLLSVTSVNSFIILFRKVVVSSGLRDFSHYRSKLTKVGNFDFAAYHSSQYNRMAEAILKEVYGK
ncbi:MAG: DGQHR domain-containing protein [Sphingopyxis sp.]|nr:DGQHR domain-containing protein [Sphingopyxis sp.]